LREVQAKLAAKLETVKKQRDDLRAQNEEMGRTLSARARAREATLQKLKLVWVLSGPCILAAICIILGTAAPDAEAPRARRKR